MARKLGIGEIFKLTMGLSPDARGEFIRQNFNPSLKIVICTTYDPAIVWDLPEGIPPFDQNQFLDQEANLYKELNRMYIFLKGSGDHVPAKKKEINFIQLLESLNVTDVATVVAMKEKKLPFDITFDMIREWLPGLLPAAPQMPVKSEVVAPEKPNSEKVELPVDKKPQPRKAPVRKPVKAAVTK